MPLYCLEIPDILDTLAVYQVFPMFQDTECFQVQMENFEKILDSFQYPESKGILPLLILDNLLAVQLVLKSIQGILLEKEWMGNLQVVMCLMEILLLWSLMDNLIDYLDNHRD